MALSPDLALDLRFKSFRNGIFNLLAKIYGELKGVCL